MTSSRKGIILAGGNATRLYPLTYSVSKQLMPVYDKPMIYYPLSTLMLTGIKEYLVIVSPIHLDAFKTLLGDGNQWGISIKYAIQEKPEGLAQAFLIAEEFIDNHPSALILGDNLYHGNELIPQLEKANIKQTGATIFVYPVSDPERYGVAEFDENKKVINLEEKPRTPKSRYAVTGIYFYDDSAVNKAKQIMPSSRGELEITSLNNLYLKENNLFVEIMGRGMAWLDTGTFDSLHQAGSYIRLLERRQGLKVGCPEEVAWRKNWINKKELKKLAENMLKSGYGKYLLDIQKDPFFEN
nr:glucose-1-phosphate thymidylyltransferase RfbA [Prochlorococcus marinus]